MVEFLKYTLWHEYPYLFSKIGFEPKIYAAYAELKAIPKFCFKFINLIQIFTKNGTLIILSIAKLKNTEDKTNIVYYCIYVESRKLV